MLKSFLKSVYIYIYICATCATLALANPTGAELKKPSSTAFDFTFQSPQNKIQESLQDMIKIEIGKENFLTRRNNNIFSCNYDSFGNTYCPSNLAKADSYWDYEDGVSTVKTTQVVDYTKMETANVTKDAVLMYSGCGSSRNFSSANSYCTGLREGGYSDWKLPKIADTAAYSTKGVPSCGGWTWTSTPYTGQNNGYFIWNGGSVSSGSYVNGGDDSSYLVRCVR